MAGTALSNFNDFVLNTGPAFLTGPEQVINEAVAQTYVLGRLLKGRGLDKVIQGGREIRDIVMFDESSTYDHYLPNQTFTWSNPQVTTEINIDWRFSIDHMAWTDQEIELNVPDGLSADAQKVVYKKLKRIKEQRMWTSMLKGIEADIWKSAHGRSTDMESSTGSLPYSIPSFITENQGTTAGADNYLPGGSTGAGGSGRWTTLMNVAPSTESGWRPQVEGYSYADPDDSGGTNTGLFDAFSRMYRKVDFRPPGTKDEYFENADMQRFMICCSLRGITLYEKLCRESQDRFAAAGGQDPSYLRPNYGGIELLYISALDTAALYYDHGATQFVSEVSSLLGGTTGAEVGVYGADWADGPRYWWINGNYLTPVFHSRRYFYKKDIMPHPNQPYTTVVPVDCWWNLFCNSRKRQGIIYPNA